MSDYYAQVEKLGYKPKKKDKSIKDRVADAISSGVSGGYDAAKGAPRYVYDRATDPVDTARGVYGGYQGVIDPIGDRVPNLPDFLPGAMNPEKLLRNPINMLPPVAGYNFLRNAIENRGEYADAVMDSPATAQDLATDSYHEAIDRLTGAEGQGRDILGGIEEVGPAAKEYSSKVHDSYDAFRQDPSIMGAAALVGTVVTAVSVPQDAVKENVGDSLYHMAMNDGEKDDFAMLLDTQMVNGQFSAVTNGISPSVYLEEHPELRPGVKLAYENGFNGYKGGRAAWEYIIGKMDTANRIKAEIVYDPTTYLAFGGAVGKGIRGTGEASMLRKAAAFPFDVLGGVDKAQDAMVTVPLKGVGKVLGKADSLVGGPTGKLFNAIGGSKPVKSGMGRIAKLLEEPERRQIQDQRDELEDLFNVWEKGERKVGIDLLEKINDAIEAKGIAREDINGEIAIARAWINNEFLPWRRQARHEAELGLEPTPMPPAPALQHVEFNEQDLNKALSDIKSAKPPRAPVVTENPKVPIVTRLREEIGGRRAIQTQIDETRDELVPEPIEDSFVNQPDPTQSQPVLPDEVVPPGVDLPPVDGRDAIGQMTPEQMERMVTVEAASILHVYSPHREFDAARIPDLELAMFADDLSISEAHRASAIAEIEARALRNGEPPKYLDSQYGFRIVNGQPEKIAGVAPFKGTGVHTEPGQAAPPVDEVVPPADPNAPMTYEQWAQTDEGVSWRVRTQLEAKANAEIAKITRKMTPSQVEKYYPFSDLSTGELRAQGRMAQGAARRRMFSEVHRREAITRRIDLEAELGRLRKAGAGKARIRELQDQLNANDLGPGRVKEYDFEDDTGVRRQGVSAKDSTEDLYNSVDNAVDNRGLLEGPDYAGHEEENLVERSEPERVRRALENESGVPVSDDDVKTIIRYFHEPNADNEFTAEFDRIMKESDDSLFNAYDQIVEVRDRYDLLTMSDAIRVLQGKPPIELTDAWKASQIRPSKTVKWKSGGDIPGDAPTAEVAVPGDLSGEDLPKAWPRDEDGTPYSIEDARWWVGEENMRHAELSHEDPMSSYGEEFRSMDTDGINEVADWIEKRIDDDLAKQGMYRSKKDGDFGYIYRNDGSPVFEMPKKAYMLPSIENGIYFGRRTIELADRKERDEFLDLLTEKINKEGMPYDDDELVDMVNSLKPGLLNKRVKKAVEAPESEIIDTTGSVSGQAPTAEVPAAAAAPPQEIKTNTPPPEKGMTRLYRAETKISREARLNRKPQSYNDMGWKSQGRLINGATNAEGRWFSAYPEEIDWYINHHAEWDGADNVVITYVDVPHREARKYRVDNLGEITEQVDVNGTPVDVKLNPGRESSRHDREHFLSRELASMDQEYVGEWPPVKPKKQLPRVRVHDVYESMTPAHKSKLNKYYEAMIRHYEEGTPAPSRNRLLPKKTYGNVESLLDSVDTLAKRAADTTSEYLRRNVKNPTSYSDFMTKTGKFLDSEAARKARYDDYVKRYNQWYKDANDAALRGEVIDPTYVDQHPFPLDDDFEVPPASIDRLPGADVNNTIMPDENIGIPFADFVGASDYPQILGWNRNGTRRTPGQIRAMLDEWDSSPMGPPEEYIPHLDAIKKWADDAEEQIRERNIRRNVYERVDWDYLNRFNQDNNAPRMRVVDQDISHATMNEMISQDVFGRPNQSFMRAKRVVSPGNVPGWSIEAAYNHNNLISSYAQMYPLEFPIVQARVRARAIGSFEEIYNGVSRADTAVLDAQLNEMFIDEFANLGIDARSSWTKRTGTFATHIEYKKGSVESLTEQLIRSPNLRNETELLAKLKRAGSIFPSGDIPKNQSQLEAQQRFMEIVRLNNKMIDPPKIGTRLKPSPGEGYKPYLRRVGDPEKRAESWDVLDAEGNVVSNHRTKADAMRSKMALTPDQEAEIEAMTEAATGMTVQGPEARLSISDESLTLEEGAYKEPDVTTVTNDEIMAMDEALRGGEIPEILRTPPDLIPNMTDSGIRKLMGMDIDYAGDEIGRTYAKQYGANNLVAQLFKRGSIDLGVATRFLETVTVYRGDPMTAADVILYAHTIAKDPSDARRIAMGILGKNMQLPEASRLMRVWDTYLNITREFMLMNFSRGLAAMVTDEASNLFMQSIKGDFGAVQRGARLDEIWSFAQHTMNQPGWEHPIQVELRNKWGRELPRSIGQTANRDLISGGMEETTIARLIDKVSNVTVKDDAGDIITKRRVDGKTIEERRRKLLGDSKLKNRTFAVATGASRLAASRTIKSLRHAGDFQNRSANFFWHMDEMAAKQIPEFFADLERRGLKLGKSADEIAEWKRALGSSFTGEDVMRVTGDTASSQSWIGRLNKAEQQAIAETNSVLFSYKMTNLDDKMRHMFLFHYWQSRAIAWHANEAIRNPWLMSTYVKSWEAMDKSMEDAGLNREGQAFWAVFTRDAYSVLLDPMAVFVPLSMFREWGDRGDEGTLDKMLRTSNLFLNPMLQAAATSIGLSSNSSDFFGSYTTRATIRAWYDEMRSLGIAPEGISGDPVGEIQNMLVRHLNDFFTKSPLGKVPGFGNKMEVQDFKASTRDDVMEIIMHQAELEYGNWADMTWQQRQEVVGAQRSMLMEDYDNPRLQRALRAYRKDAITERSLRMVTPGNPMTIYIPEEQRDKLSQEGYDSGGLATPEQESAMASSQQVSAGSAVAAELTASDEFYKNELGSQEGRDFYKTYNAIFYGSLTAPITIGDMTIQPADINGLPPEDRQEVADLWTAEQPERGQSITELREGRKAFRAGNPEQDAFIRYGAAVRDGNKTTNRAVLRDMYPEFKKRESDERHQQRKKGKSEDEIEAYLNDIWLPSIEAYTAILGEKAKLRDPQPLPFQPIPMVPGGGTDPFASLGQAGGSVQSGRPSGFGSSGSMPYQNQSSPTGQPTQGSPGVPDKGGALRKELSAYLDGSGPLTPSVQQYLNWSGRLRALGPWMDTSVSAYMDAHTAVASLSG